MPERIQRREVEARLAGQSDFGAYGDAGTHIRYAQRTDSRKRCRCGCRTRVTHIGMANGVALTSGCIWHVYSWVDDPLYRHRQAREEAR